MPPMSPLGRFTSSVAVLYLVAFALVLTRDALLPFGPPSSTPARVAALRPQDANTQPAIEPEAIGRLQEASMPAHRPAPPSSDDIASPPSYGAWLGPPREALTTTIQSGERDAWRDHNQRVLKDLHECLATRTCGEHQDKVLILQDDNYRKAFIENLGGEKIWSRSVLRALDQLGVTYFFAAEYQLVEAYYSMLPDLIKATVMQCEALEKCWADKEGDCLKTKDNPHGLPIEQLFCSEFFGHAIGSPLGAQWSLAPEPFQHQPVQYWGYSIEDECTQTDVVPFEQRLHRVWVLAKHYRYFTADNFPYSPDIFVRASAELGIEFVGAYDYNDVEPPFVDFPGVRNLGRDGKVLEKEEFEHEVRQSLAIVGLWDPVISPSPWYGLCWGLPFINPGDYDFAADGQIEHIRYSQHEFAAREGEPHVYNVQRHDDDAFMAALRRATSTAHASYIPDRMREAALRDRLVAFLETDFASRLRDLLADDAPAALRTALREKEAIYG